MKTGALAEVEGAGHVAIAENGHLLALGNRVRALRSARDLTLQTVANRTGLSASMISMVERGLTSPSIGTLVSIASTLGVHMSDLFDFPVDAEHNPVHPADDQQTVTTPTGVVRRLAQLDERRGVELVVNEYPPGSSSADAQTHHTGHEYGIVLEGQLVVELGDHRHELGPGDAIAYDSDRPHRICNEGPLPARTIWVNLDR